MADRQWLRDGGASILINCERAIHTSVDHPSLEKVHDFDFGVVRLLANLPKNDSLLLLTTVLRVACKVNTLSSICHSNYLHRSGIGCGRASVPLQLRTAFCLYYYDSVGFCLATSQLDQQEGATKTTIPSDDVEALWLRRRLGPRSPSLPRAPESGNAG